MKGPIIVVDIGNTSTSLGCYRRGRVVRMDRLSTTMKEPRILEQRLRKLAGRTAPVGVCLASVVPDTTPLWKRASCRVWPGIDILEVTHRLNLGVGIDYPRPQTIGADRLCNACAAVARYGVPVIVADFGTAVTFDVISADRKYVGGVIAPGLPLMFTYLWEKTALLPRVEWGRVKHRVGKSTVEAMRLGAIWGYRGLVREICKELGRGIKKNHITYCATGGYARRVLQKSELNIRIDEDLTLYGLGRIYELNRGGVGPGSSRPKVEPGLPRPGSR